MDLLTVPLSALRDFLTTRGAANPVPSLAPSEIRGRFFDGAGVFQSSLYDHSPLSTRRRSRPGAHRSPDFFPRWHFSHRTFPCPSRCRRSLATRHRAGVRAPTLTPAQRLHGGSHSSTSDSANGGDGPRRFLVVRPVGGLVGMAAGDGSGAGRVETMLGAV